MFAIVEIVIVFASVIGGYMLNGGHMGVLFQPLEWLIIMGAALGSLLIGNPKDIIMGVVGNFAMIFKGPHHGKDAYVDCCPCCTRS